VVDAPLWWSVDQLITAYANGHLSPVEVANMAEARIAEVDPILHAYVERTTSLARDQARAAERAYRDGTAGPLAGVPVSIKDAFDIEGHVTTLGSLAHAHDMAPSDSGAVRRLRKAGAVFVGKTNTPEFCQSATTDNLLRPDTANPWDASRTSGGSSGGAAASVAMGSCTLALGSDGGGSIRIPASFCGLVGLKPTYGSTTDAERFEAFSPFISVGSLARTVADIRDMDAVLRETSATVGSSGHRRVAWCARPEGRPVQSDLLRVVAGAVSVLGDAGHRVEAVDLDLGGWEDIFGPLVLAEEGARRGHLLHREHALTDYERLSLEAALNLEEAIVTKARAAQPSYRDRIDRHFDTYDVLATPATATPAFELGHRPNSIEGQRVARLWGAFPFAVPFNVSGHPAIVLPVGFVSGLPVAIQLVGRYGEEADLLEVAGDLEAALDLDLFQQLPSYSPAP